MVRVEVDDLEKEEEKEKMVRVEGGDKETM
jgi:hypothetical protein